MTQLDQFFWWSGAVLWLAAGSVALLFVGERILDWSLTCLKMKRDFLLWAFERARERSNTKEG
jgi:hypothetical protein